MNNLVPTQKAALDLKKIEQVLIKGDLATLNEGERVSYYNAVCESVGLNPLTQPFTYLSLGGRLVLYANKGCAEQLRSIHEISIEEVDAKKFDELVVVIAKAKSKDGRTDSSTGAVSVGNLKGEALANAMMKAETKAKRRVTLSLCGLNMLDESEVDSISGAEKVVQPPAVPAQISQKPAADPRDEKLVSQAQIKRMFEIMRKKSIKNDELQTVILELYGYSLSKEMKRFEYDELTKQMESLSKDAFFTWYVERIGQKKS